MKRIKSIALHLIRLYQFFVSPMLGPTCRFVPSCSEYAHQAIFRYGLCKGGLLAVRRLLRCHPFHPGGVDPVPRNSDPPEAPAFSRNLPKP